MRKLLFLSVIFFAATAFAKEISFSINGDVNNLNGTVKLHVYSNGQYQLYKSAEAKDGKFVLSGSLSEPQLAVLQLSDSVKKNVSWAMKRWMYQEILRSRTK